MEPHERQIRISSISTWTQCGQAPAKAAKAALILTNFSQTDDEGLRQQKHTQEEWQQMCSIIISTKWSGFRHLGAYTWGCLNPWMASVLSVGRQNPLKTSVAQNGRA